MNLAAILSAALLASTLPGAAAAPLIKVGHPFPLAKLPIVGQEGRFGTIEAYRGRKLLLHLFASW